MEDCGGCIWCATFCIVLCEMGYLWRPISGSGEGGHVEECDWVLRVSFREDHLILIFFS